VDRLSFSEFFIRVELYILYSKDVFLDNN